MKLPSRFALPPLDSSARLPLVLASLLALALAFQLLVPGAAEPPPSAPIAGARGAAAPLPPALPAGGAGLVLARQLFTPPARAVAAGGSAAPPDPLAGYAVSGTVRVGRALRAIVTTPSGRIVDVPLGGRIGAWRLAGLSATDARLVRGGERRIVPFGAGTPASAPVPEEGSQP